MLLAFPAGPFFIKKLIKKSSGKKANKSVQPEWLFALEDRKEGEEILFSKMKSKNFRNFLVKWSQIYLRALSTITGLVFINFTTSKAFFRISDNWSRSGAKSTA